MKRGRPRKDGRLFEGPTGPQAIRGYLKMRNKGHRTMGKSYEALLKKADIGFLAGYNWLYRGTVPRPQFVRKIAQVTNGWVTSTEWYGDRKPQRRWMANQHLWRPK